MMATRTFVAIAALSAMTALNSREGFAEEKSATAPAAAPEKDGKAPTESAENNILLNPSFEEGDRTPAKWASGAKLDGVTYLWDRGNGNTGKASLCLKKSANRYFPIAQWFQIVNRKGDSKSLKVSAQVKTDQTHKAIIDVIFLDADSNGISHEWVSYIGEGVEDKIQAKLRVDQTLKSICDLEAQQAKGPEGKPAISDLGTLSLRISEILAEAEAKRLKEVNNDPLTHDWKEYSGVVTIPPNTKKLQINLQIYGPGKVWFDDIKAEYVE